MFLFRYDICQGSVFARNGDDEDRNTYTSYPLIIANHIGEGMQVGCDMLKHKSRARAVMMIHILSISVPHPR